jgi:hypothetical protein
MPGDGVLARRRLTHSADSTSRRLCRDGPADVDNPIETECPKGRDTQPHLPGDVPERVAPFVTVHLCILEGTDADAVEHDNDDSGKGSGHG